MTRRGFVGRMLAGFAASWLSLRRAWSGEHPAYLMWDGEKIHEVWGEMDFIPEAVRRAWGDTDTHAAVMPFVIRPLKSMYGFAGTTYWMGCWRTWTEERHYQQLATRKVAEAWLRAQPPPNRL